MTPPDVLTPKGVAAMLATSPRQVRRLPIPKVVLGPRTVRYLRQDVLDYLASLAKPFGLRKVG